MSLFYRNIIDTNSDLSKAFEELAKDSTTDEWKKLQDQFHEQIENDYPTIRCEITPKIIEERNPIPERITKRIKVAAMLLNILALGGKYSRSLYLKTLDFCTTVDVKNGSLA